MIVLLAPTYVMLGRLLWVASQYVTQHRQMFGWFERTQIRTDAVPGLRPYGRK